MTYKQLRALCDLETETVCINRRTLESLLDALEEAEEDADELAHSRDRAVQQHLGTLIALNLLRARIAHALAGD